MPVDTNAIVGALHEMYEDSLINIIRTPDSDTWYVRGTTEEFGGTLTFQMIQDAINRITEIRMIPIPGSYADLKAKKEMEQTVSPIGIHDCGIDYTKDIQFDEEWK